MSLLIDSRLRGLEKRLRAEKQQPRILSGIKDYFTFILDDTSKMMKNAVPKFYDNLGSVERFKKATVVPHVAKKINQFCKTSGADGESTHVGYFPKICRMDKPLDLNFYIGMVQKSV